MSGTVHGAYKQLGGAVAAGQLVITVNTEGQVVRDPVGNVVFQGPQAVKLNKDGLVTLTLPASDDSTLEPSGFTYAIVEQLSHVARTAYRVVEFQVTNGGTIELADLAATDEAALDPSYGANLNAVLAELDGRLSPTDLAASMEHGLTPDNTPFRAGYDSPGGGRDARFSLDGYIAANPASNQRGDHRLWSWSNGDNVASVRNKAPDSDSAVKFLDADTGLERGAIGYHNRFTLGDDSTAFYDATFLEASRYIALDGSADATKPVQALRLITTGYLEGQGFGPMCKIGLEANGDTNLYYPTAVWTGRQTALRVRADYAGVEIGAKLRIGTSTFAPGGAGTAPEAALDVRGQAVIGTTSGSRAGEVSAGHHLNIIGDDASMIRLLRANVGKVDLYMQSGRLQWVDPDHGSKVIMTMHNDGTQNVAFGGDNNANFGGGKNVVYLTNTTQAPTSAAGGGGLLYVESGALKYRGTSGTVTTVGAA